MVPPRAWTAGMTFALLAVYVLWGSTYLGMRWLVETVPPFLAAAARFLVAGILLFSWLMVRGAPWPTGRQWWGAGAVGTLLLVAANGTLMWAEQSVDSGFAALVIATVPLLMATLDPLLFGGPRPTAGTLAALAVGLGGVVLLMSEGLTAAGAATASVWVLLFVALAWAIGSLVSRHVARPSSILVGAAMQMIFGGILLVFVGLALGEGPRLHVEEIRARSWGALAFLVFGGSLIGYSCYVWLLQVGTPALVGTYAYVNPIVALALGAWLAQEALTARTLMAAVVILASVAWVSMNHARHAAKAKTHADGQERGAPGLPVAPEAETRSGL